MTMTTREEFALAFATAQYRSFMDHLLQAGRSLTEQEADVLDRQCVKGAVEMADLLIAQLNLADIPPKK